jgi:ferredoxin-NADP reductase
MSFASDPADHTMHHDPLSSYKHSMQELHEGSEIAVFKIKREFTLPEPKEIVTPLVFVSGGVGMTPFLNYCQTGWTRYTSRITENLKNLSYCKKTLNANVLR